MGSDGKDNPKDDKRVIILKEDIVKLERKRRVGGGLNLNDKKDLPFKKLTGKGMVGMGNHFFEY